MGAMFGKGGMPGGGAMPSQAEIEAAQKQLGAGGLPGLGGGGMSLPPGLSGFGKKK
jgi:signal recognition particle subunit SRP54